MNSSSSSFVIYIIVCSCYALCFNFMPLAYAEDSLGDSIDCTEVRIDYSDDPTLSREERLRLMDKAFFESLNRFEMCQAAKAKAKAAGGGGGGEGSGSESSSQEAAGEAAGTSTVESVASSTMSGTESPKKYPPVEGIETGESGPLQKSQNIDEGDGQTGGTLTRANGKLPEDIPPAQNDDALAAQIRYAAENETDPVKQKQLWNEYRKYKGLALKK